ncbi:hypothetical protein [Limnohabitans planktonicus]|uniref:HEAT repeat domain-containing protein n=1 Tax=Limnohabitans planktonicus II-D5 TaxID=1293045 RepID=A0A2T7UJ76_9BURK|nr:hypothetical protein [Limnohabitans planktonicus]PVE44740.1 hypothetical protein H663_001650 [Limnohabitans planktonicus II-D5]|eukprot:gene24276-30596_t
MQKVLDDYPALAAAIRNLLSAGVTASEVAGLMAHVNSETKLVPLKKMDAWERSIRDELWASERGATETSWKFWMRPRRFTSWLDLCSHDGRKREAALRVNSADAPSAFLLALGLRRLNDWVPQVRSAARETLPELASNSEPQDVADVLWSLLEHWSTWGRMEPADREAVVAIASREPVSLALKSKIMSTTAGPAALVLSQCARLTSFDSWIGEFAQGAVQPTVRARAFRWMFVGRSSWVVGRKWKWTDVAYCKGKLEPILESRDLPANQPFMATLCAAMEDRSPMVRRVAAEFLIRELASIGDNAFVLAHRTASDPNPSVAERGNFALKQLNQKDAAAPKNAA